MKLRLLIFFTGFAIAATPHALRAQGNEADSKFAKEGIEAAKRKDWDKAVENLRKAIAADPNDNRNSVNLALALQERGVARVQKNGLDEGIADLSESLKIKGDNVTAHRFRGYALLTKRDYQHAIEDYDAVIGPDGNDVEALDRRAYAFTALKQYDKAIGDYTAMIKAKSKDIRGYLGRSYVLDTTNQSKPAMDDVNKALELDPKNEVALNRKKRLEAVMKAAAKGAPANGAAASPGPAVPPAAGAPVPAATPH